MFCCTLEERGWREGRPGPGMHEAHTGRSRAEPNRTEQIRTVFALYRTEPCSQIVYAKSNLKTKGLGYMINDLSKQAPAF